MAPLTQPHVLVLDPDPSSRVLLTAVFDQRGLRVTACGAEREAVDDCLRRDGYALVVLSSDMPALASLLRRLNAAPAARRPKIIIATASEVALPPQHADLVLTKPFHLDELHTAIADCCSLGSADGSRRDTAAGSANASRTQGTEP